MPSDPWFEISERHAYTGSNSWRLKGGHIHFRGRDSSGNPLPAVLPVSAPKEKIAPFIESLDFLDVWNWRPDYSPTECGYTVMDGMSWTLKGVLGGREINAGGENAYPSLQEIAKSSLESGRYSFLLFTFFRSFGIKFSESFFPEKE